VPLKPTEPPATIALLSTALPPWTYKRCLRHTHQSPPLFCALAPLICAHIASPSSFNLCHCSSLVTGKIPSLRCHFLPVVRFAPPLLHFGAITLSPRGRSRPGALASVSAPPDRGHGPRRTGRSSGPQDRGLGSRPFYLKKKSKIQLNPVKFANAPPEICIISILVLIFV
jgi:hypothetical protein